MTTFSFISKREHETIELAKQIASEFKAGDVVILSGNLGTGKTHFVKGIAQSYSYSGEVTSPTFNLANFYETETIRILHLDLYRIEDETEFENLGLTEYFEDSIVFVEWGNKIQDSLEANFELKIELGSDKTERKLIFNLLSSASTQQFENIKEKISQLS